MRLRLLMLCLTCTIFLATPDASASVKTATADTIAVIPTDLEGSPGDLVNVPIFLTSTGRLTRFTGYQLTFYYDDSVLQFERVFRHGRIEGILGEPYVQNTGRDKLTVGVISDTGAVSLISTQELLVSLQFRINGQVGDSSALRIGLLLLLDNNDALNASSRDGLLRVVDSDEPSIADTLAIDPLLTAPGLDSLRPLLVKLNNNTQDICGVQFTFDYKPLVLDIDSIRTSTRTNNGWRVEFEDFEDSVNVVLFSELNTPLLLTDEPILEIYFSFSPEKVCSDTFKILPGDTFEFPLKNSLASDCDGRAVPLANKSGSVTIMEKGDLDLDEDITQVDLNTLIKHVLDPSLQTVYSKWAGDLDLSCYLDIPDIVIMNRIITRGDTSGSIPVVVQRDTNLQYLFWGERLSQNTQVVLPFLFRTTENVLGLQFTLHSDQIGKLSNPTLAVNDPNLRVAFHRDETKMHILVYNIRENPLSLNGDVLLHFIDNGLGSAFPEIVDQVAVIVSEKSGATPSQSLKIQVNSPENADKKERDMSDLRQGKMPQSFRLLQNHPNPFRSSTTFHFELDNPGDLRIEIFDLMGRSVATLQHYGEKPGTYQLTWNGLAANGRKIPAGMYYYKAIFNSRVKTGRFLRIE